MKTKAEWMAGVNTGDPANDNYSVLSTLVDAMKLSADSKFLFKMAYPRGGSSAFGDMIWKQSTNPATQTEGQAVGGYEGVAIPVGQDGLSWGGLQRAREGLGVTLSANGASVLLPCGVRNSTASFPLKGNVRLESR